MRERPLTSDELGEKGEKRFGEICADAKIIANAASRDRAGWDYILDFPLQGALVALDSRPAPVSARVQVKTQWSDRDEIKLRLSSAEQLVKFNGPSFICVLSVDHDLGFARMRLIHCRGDIVARVLKRLRKAEQRGEKPNDVWLRIQPSKYGAALPVDRAALRGALEAVCSTDALAYLTAKQTELKSIGFDQGYMQLKISFRGTEEEIVDAFLGLKPIKAADFKALQTRFDIPLPIPGMPEGPQTLFLTPEGEPCELIARTGGRTLRFKSLCFRPPEQVFTNAIHTKALVRTAALDVALTVRGQQSGKIRSVDYTFGPRQDADENLALKARDWQDAYAFLAGLTTDGVDLEIRYKRRPVFRQTIRDPHLAEAQRWQKLARLTTAAARVFDQAGAPNAKVTLQALWSAGDELTTLAAIIRDDSAVTRISFSTGPEVALPRDAPLDMMLGHGFRVGEAVIAYATSLSVCADSPSNDEGADTGWSSEKVGFLGVRRVKSQRDFRSFLDALPRHPYRVITGVFQSDETPSILQAARRKLG